MRNGPGESARRRRGAVVHGEEADRAPLRGVDAEMEDIRPGVVADGIEFAPRGERSARELVARAPFSESGYRVLMEALAQRGNVAQALQVYDDLVHLLSDELGVPPSPATRDLHAHLLRPRAG